VDNENQNPTQPEKENGGQVSVAEQARQVCTKLIKFFPLFGSPHVRAWEEEDKVLLEIDGDKSGILIGKHGQTLMALEFVLARIVQHQTNTTKRLHIDCEGYRKRRKAMLENLAAETADEVAETKNPIGLGPMSSDERKIIHLILKDHPEVYTESEDIPPNRQVVVKPRQN
jgi:spoIIIJ-associated protein